jgi:hypothetical protein
MQQPQQPFFDAAGNVETHEHTGDFKEWLSGDVCGPSGETKSRHAAKRDG